MFPRNTYCLYGGSLLYDLLPNETRRSQCESHITPQKHKISLPMLYRMLKILSMYKHTLSIPFKNNGIQLKVLPEELPQFFFVCFPLV
jgi:hypothetical protein